MADRNMKFTLDFLAKTAGLKNAEHAVKAVGDEFDETGDKGKALAQVLSRSADAIESDLKNTTEIAERLRVALGDAFDGGGAGSTKINAIAADMSKLGLTAKEVDDNIDMITASLKRLDAAESSLDGMGLSMKNVGAETDNTRSVFANFAGNAAQELPGVTDAFGPLNMAISQFTEYAAEGNINLANFAKFAGPMAIIGGLAAGVAKHMQDVAETKAFHKDRVQQFVKLLGETNREASELAKILTQEDDPLEWMRQGDTQNLTKDLYEAGITFDELMSHANDSKEAFRAWAEAGVGGGETLNHMLNWHMQYLQDVQAATEQVAAETFVYGETTAQAAERVAAAKRRGDALTDTLDRQQQAYEELTAAVEAQYEATRASIDANFAMQRAQDDLNQSIQDAATIQDDATTATDEARMAQLDAQDAALTYADSMVRLAEEQAAMRGETLSTAEKQGVMVAALENVLSTLEPGSPLYIALQQYIAQLNAIPKSINTSVSINGKEVTVGGGGQGAALTLKPNVKTASGTRSAPPGLALVGEQGPELVSYAGGERVFSNPETTDILRNGLGGGGMVNYFTIYTQATDGEQLARELKEYMRRNGGRL